MHENRVVHRDLKCSNILVDDNGVVKLSDFGFAKLPLSSGGGPESSLNWMAPEVFEGSESTAQDIWSVGCCMLEMITGRPPFHDCEPKTLPSLLSKLKEPPPYPETISQSMRSFLDQCFQINPHKRPSAFDLLCHPFVLLNNQREVRESLDAVNSIRTHISFQNNPILGSQGQSINPTNNNIASINSI